jgi:hypothetical protein
MGLIHSLSMQVYDQYMCTIISIMVGLVQEQCIVYSFTKGKNVKTGVNENL